MGKYILALIIVFTPIWAISNNESFKEFASDMEELNESLNNPEPPREVETTQNYQSQESEVVGPFSGLGPYSRLNEILFPVSAQ